MLIRVVPTLARMAAVYALPRDGGAASPRFRAYVQAAATDWGLSAYNPMAGVHAAHAVDALVALDAEALAAEAAAAVETVAEASPMAVRDHAPPLRLAIVVLSAGLWTERVTADSLHRTHGSGGWHRGLVPFWSTDLVSAVSVRRAAAREATRLLWEAIHGPARSVRGVLAREGMAWAVAEVVAEECATGDDVGMADGIVATGDVGAAHGPAPTTAPADVAVVEALALLGASEALDDVVAVLLGDATAAAHGWHGVGLGPEAGHRHAVALIRRTIAAHGVPAALRLPPSGMAP